jgi:hypothetical protein
MSDGRFVAWDIKPGDFPRMASLKEKMLFLVSYGILAPSTHNSQPWLFKVSNGSIQLFSDPYVKLTESDPKGSYLYISLGCCLENIILTAKYYKMYKGLKYYGLKKSEPVAEVLIRNQKNAAQVERQYEQLLRAMTKRVNTRGVFKPDKINPKVIKKLRNINRYKGIKTSFETSRDSIGNIADLSAEGIRRVYGKREFRLELADWINSNYSKKARGIPAYSLRMSNIMSLVFPPLLRLLNLSLPIAKVNKISINSLPLICIISSKKDDCSTWLNVGRLAERLMLKLNAENISTSIFVASLEMSDLKDEVKKLTKTKLTPQFLFCAGHPKISQKHTPRLTLESRLI